MDKIDFDALEKRVLEESGREPRFRTATAQALLKRGLEGSTMRVRKDANEMVAEVMRCVVVEAVHRAVQVADAHQEHELTLTHLEQILPQLLMDF